MKFRAVIKTEGGKEEKRVIEAASRFAVYEQVEKEGNMVVSLTEGGGGGFSFPKWMDIKLTSGIKTEEKITFTKNLSAMLSAGLTLSRALSVIERQSSNKNLKLITADLEESVKKGDSFHDALARHSNVFSKLFIAMTKAGEESGTLADSLKVVAKQMDRSYTLSRKVRGAMIYPAVILFAIIVIGIGFYRGWFAITSDRDAETHKVDVRLTVDSDKVKQDTGSVTGNSGVREEENEHGQ